MFNYDGSVKRIPLAYLRTLLANLTFGNEEFRSIRNIESGENNAGSLVDKTQLRLTAHYNRFLTIIGISLNRTQILKGYLTCLTSRVRILSSRITSHTTGVERTKRKLCTRLTNSLSSNHANSLALLYHPTSSQVTAVTLSTNTMFSLASQYRADFHSLNASIYNTLCFRLANLLTCSYNQHA